MSKCEREWSPDDIPLWHVDEMPDGLAPPGAPWMAYAWGLSTGFFATREEALEWVANRLAQALDEAVTEQGRRSNDPGDAQRPDAG